ncbi:MAG: DUF3888 domain-containing protein [Burkholderiales bacterium]
MIKKNAIIILLITFVLVLCAITITCTIFSKELNLQSELVLTVFGPELQKASDDFYSEYLSDNPLVYNYSGKIISLKKSKYGYYYGYYIKFGIEPVIGPHDPIGYDEVEYFVYYDGTIKLLNFTHMKNYEIPPRSGVTIKKPIPIS